jgi:hypothetical protein
MSDIVQKLWQLLKIFIEIRIMSKPTKYVMNFKNTKRIYKLIDFYSKIEGILQN